MSWLLKLTLPIIILVLGCDYHKRCTYTIIAFLYFMLQYLFITSSDCSSNNLTELFHVYIY